ncbi:hypothetical protein HYFRA_00002021 [Hymenoscyphus fraxineus]|uniref:Uncharacterized protein n=1 Tax=Hymenoscyphus fraxineus TaxID=746836 RepID=A0A9N9KL19_9HELO|nr:hypothetical protein HYFRA_00002021 [Hymenoscyphus fraxineus]
MGSGSGSSSSKHGSSRHGSSKHGGSRHGSSSKSHSKKEVVYEQLCKPHRHVQGHRFLHRVSMQKSEMLLLYMGDPRIYSWALRDRGIQVAYVPQT